MDALNDRPLRVLIRHPNPLFSAGLAAVLATQADLDVAMFSSRTAEPALPGRAFDVLVGDLETGLRALGERQCQPLFARGHERPRLLIIASDYWPAEVRRAIESGAAGFLAAHCTARELQAAVRAVGDGLQYICEEAAGTMAGGMGRDALTERQAEVLRLLTQGRPNKSIARELGVTADTVKSHVKHIMERLGVSSRVQAVTLALQRGLVAQALTESAAPARRIVRQGRIVAQIPAQQASTPAGGFHGRGKPVRRRAGPSGARTSFFPS